MILLDVSERILALLKERNWSIYKLSQMSGVAHSTITNIFERNTAPTIPTLEAICKGFNLSIAQFFLGDEESVLLTPDESELLKQWNSLKPRQREAFRNLLDSFLYDE